MKNSLLKVWVIVACLVVSAIPGNSLSLRNPFVTEKSEWDQIVEKVEGIPFKHRVYGDAEAVVMRVVDGDTLYVRMTDVHPILGYEIGIRVYGIDTRELDDGGDKSKEFVKSILRPGYGVRLKNMRRGKYFRIVADVYFGDPLTEKSLAEVLLDKDLAYPYYGGKKRPKGWTPEEYNEEDSE